MSSLASDTLNADVAQAARGDREAFARLVRATTGLVTAITAVESRDLEASRDAAQEAYLHAWRDLPSLRNLQSFLPWLRELARRRAREARGRAGALVTGVQAEEALAAAVDAAPGAVERMLRAEERRLFQQALDALPDEARETVVLYYREGRSAAHVARLLGLSEEAVWQRLSRARTALREDLLSRAGDLFERSAPGAAFAAGVLAALGTTAPVAAGAATASGVGASATAGAVAGTAAVVGGAGLLASLAMGGETRLFLECAEGEDERRAVRRYGRFSQASIAVFAVGLPVLAAALKLSWLFTASFGAYALSLVVLQRTMVPSGVLTRVKARRGACTALRVGQALGLVLGVACLALAAWWYTR
jgi:RNA polymerase sigma factor (sigma-70 family)